MNDFNIRPIFLEEKQNNPNQVGIRALPFQFLGLFYPGATIWYLETRIRFTSVQDPSF